jgi:hypothetical protein
MYWSDNFSPRMPCQWYVRGGGEGNRRILVGPPTPFGMAFGRLKLSPQDSILYNRVGWFWTCFTFSTKVPLRFLTYISKVPKIAKQNFFDPLTASSLATTFWVMHYIRVKTFLFTIWTSWVSKDAEYYVHFKNINLP